MRRSSLWRWPGRFLVMVMTMAAVLVPAWAAPSRTISIPLTQAATMVFPGAHAAGFTTPMERFSIAPTHIGFVWRGGSGSALSYRLQSPSGISRWHRVPEADDLRHGQVHYSAVLSVEGATGVQWRASVPPRASLGSVSLHYMNTMSGPRVAEQVPAVAEALAHTPHIVTRAQWGADESIKRTTGGCQRQFYPVQQVFIHHTAGTNFDPHPRATMRAIYYFHVKVRGWCDIGYNFVIGPHGTIYEGRWARDYAPWETHTSESRSGLGVMGAHVLGYNAGSIGISVMGNYSLVHVPTAVRSSLARLVAWEADRHHLKPKQWHLYRSPATGITRRLPYIAGHRDAGPTACPGNFLYAILPALRQATAGVIGAGKKDSSLTLQTSSNDVTYGDSATVSGTLRTGSGDPVAFTHLRLYLRRVGHEPWHWVKVTTSKQGVFSYRVAPHSKLDVAARFRGHVHRWGSESPLRVVLVTPTLGLTPQGGTTDASGVVHYPAGTTKVLLSGRLQPPHGGTRVRVRILRWNPHAKHVRLASIWTHLDATGHFKVSFGVPDPGTGTYRAVAMFPSDGDHTTARSDPRFFAIDPTG